METQQSDKRFCVWVLGLTVGGAILIAVANFCVNPYAQYPTRFLDPLVHTSRSQKVTLISELSSPPEGLVLGSSRVMKLEPQKLHEKTGLQFFNAGMNYARVEDLLAFLRYYEELYQKSPEMIIVGLDVAGFSEAPVDARLLSQPQLGSRVPEASGLAGRYRRWQELLSWQQSVATLKSLKRTMQGGTIDEPPPETFLADGLKVYHEREQAIAEGKYDFQSALEYNQREYKHLMAGYDRLSPLRKQLFDSLVSHCHEHGIELSVFLTPLHPQLATYLDGSTAYVDRREELNEFLSAAADHYGFSFLDLSEVESFSGNPDLFVDGIHPLEPNTRKMIDRLWSEMREQTKYVVQ